MKRFASLIALVAVLSRGEAQNFRLFKNDQGKEIKATFQGMNGTKVLLLREDGKSFEIEKSKLSAADQAFVDAAKPADAALFEKLNQAAGLPFLQAVPLIATPADEIAKILKLPLQSKTNMAQSWRDYPAFLGKKSVLFGAKPYSVALYANASGKATELSIVYANKGDFGSKVGMGRDHFNEENGNEAPATSLSAAMEADASKIAETLTAVLGAGKMERFGEGKAREMVTRWDWNQTSFLLTNKEEEYVSLSIVPIALANSGGKVSVVNDMELKQQLRKGVERKDNGDVFLSQVPMVDQGPKGYCAPATFERAMRLMGLMGLNADMYLLAMIGGTSDRGTSIVQLTDAVKSEVRRKGRRIKEEQAKKIKISEIKRSIDQGIPAMWTMCSVEDYNQISEKLTEKRKTITNWSTYSTELAAFVKEYSSKEKPKSNHHICMIIGYNEQTNEIAVSDSWGQNFALRWVPAVVADWVSLGDLLYITP